jgi:anaerobic magnesium-protoporphyrin IX monomethyl ester cyclase
MKVVLVNPSITHGMRHAIDVEGAWPPLGLLYLATMLRQNGVPVKVLDNGPLGYPPQEIFDWIKGEKPDIVGFHTLSISTLTANETSKLIKKQMPHVKVIYGGYHASLHHQKILKEKEYVDIVVRGEGEYSLPEVVESIEKGKNLREISGISFRQDGKIHVNPARPLIEDLDSIPFPDRRFLENEYFGAVNGVKTAVRKFTSVISSRGCPFHCRFCCESIHEFKTWRARSPKNVVDELLYLKSLGYGQVYFQDDSFTLDKKRVIELCNLMKHEKLDLLWAAMGRVGNASTDLLVNMRYAGCQSIFFGIESATQRILDYYQKGITRQMAKDAVKNCLSAKMDAFGGFILGAPSETADEMWETIRFAEKIGVSFPSFYVLHAYPGTAIWNENVEKGYIDEEEHWETGVVVPDLVPECVPTEHVKAILRRGYRHFLTRPKFALSHINKIVVDPVRRDTIIKNLSLKGARTVLNSLFHAENY